jgi:beta-glucosidase
MNHYKILALAALIIAVLASTSIAQNTSSLPYMNPKLTPEERAADLVHRMTLEEKASQLVNQARAVPRLNIPSYDWWSEALHGVISDGVTEFPEPIGLAATFDVPRIHEMATAIGVEGPIKHTQRSGGHHCGKWQVHGLHRERPTRNRSFFSQWES